MGGVLGVALVAGGAAVLAMDHTVIPRARAPVPVTAVGGRDEPAPLTEEKVAALFKLWNDALATGEAAKVADRYAPDAVLLPTQSNRVRRTRDQIIDYFRHFLEAKPSGSIKESTITVLGPTAAVDAGVYVFGLTREGKKQQIEARYTFVHELRDGKWLIVNHHSSAMPEPAK